MERHRSSTITIRDARDDERAAIRDLTLAAYAEYATIMRPSAWSALHEVILATLDSAEQVVRVVAEQEGVLVGSVMLYPPAAKAYGEMMGQAACPEVRLLAVAPSARGRGIGRALMDECVRRARCAGATTLGLHTSESMRSAIHMYEQMGFVRAEEDDFRPSGAELVMGYRLSLAEPMPDTA